MFTYFRVSSGHTPELLDLVLSHIENADGPPEVVEVRDSEIVYRVSVSA